MDTGGRVSGDFEPVDLNTASHAELLSIWWISARDVEGILQHRGPEGHLSRAKMSRLTSLDEERLGALVRQGIVTVRLDEDAANIDDAHSETSVTSSMLEEIEAIREENRLLREAMENQSQVQQEVLTRFIGDMVTGDTTRPLPTGEQFVDSVWLRAVAGDTSRVINDVKGANESFAWDSVEQLVPTLGNAARSTNLFLMPVYTQDPGNEPARGRPGTSETRYVPSMLGNASDQDVRPVGLRTMVCEMIVCG